MVKRDLRVSEIHDELDQKERDLVMREFRSGSSRVLLTTDLLARGIDVQSVAVIVNYDVPDDLDAYLHRAGRSGRYGRRGAVINFALPTDMALLKKIEKYYDINVDELPMDF